MGISTTACLTFLFLVSIIQFNQAVQLLVRHFTINYIGSLGQRHPATQQICIGLQYYIVNSKWPNAKYLQCFLYSATLLGLKTSYVNVSPKCSPATDGSNEC